MSRSLLTDHAGPKSAVTIGHIQTKEKECALSFSRHSWERKNYMTTSMSVCVVSRDWRHNILIKKLVHIPFTKENLILIRPEDSKSIITRA